MFAGLAALLLLGGCGDAPSSDPSPDAAAADAAPAPEAPMDTPTPDARPEEPAMSLYDLTVPSLEGEPVDLGAFRGRVAVVVNTASKCGLTPQYEGLQQLHETYKDQGVVILGFPSNDFMNQEPGDADDIRAFCTENFGVTFPMFAKVQTKDGEGQAEIYERLHAMTGELPSWNFSKYVISKDGTKATFFEPTVAPDAKELAEAIRTELDQS